MSSLNINTPRVLTTLSASMGALALAGGAYGLFDPVSFGTGFGITVTSGASPAVPFARATAARNFGSGLGILTLLYLGDTRSVGTLLLAGTSTTLLDAWICFRHVGDKGKAWGHAFMGLVAATLGWSLRSSAL